MEPPTDTPSASDDSSQLKAELEQAKQDLENAGKTEPAPNDRCVCGSGRKYKKCCGNKFKS